MFWFRPDALDGLFAKQFRFEDFADEDGQLNGALVLAIERRFCHFAQGAGYRSIIL